MTGGQGAAAAEARRRLEALIRAPSVSTDPAYAEGMEAARRLLESWLGQAGFAGARRLTDAGRGHPALYAEWLGAPGRPTILIYGHYDVQPPDPLDRWTSPPFEPEEREGRLYGRGASDDKGPVAVALAAMAALLTAEGRLPVNVKVMLEGEEECGSPSLPDILAAHRDLLAADAALSADGARWRPDLTTLNVGSRGSGGLEIRVITAAKDLHSGRHGGVVPNALHVLARIVASLHGDDGRILVPGYLDDVTPPTAADRAALAAIPWDSAANAAAVGAKPFGEAAIPALERLWLRPTIEVNGLWGGYTGPGGKTVIPAEAQAKLTTRLAPGQDPARARALLVAHLRRVCPPHARLEIFGDRGWTPAYGVPPDHPLLLAAEAVLAAMTGAPPLRVRIGATLPLSPLVKAALGIDTVMFSWSLADENFHGPDEFFRVSSLAEGVAAWTALLRRLGSLSAADFAGHRESR